MSDDKTAATDVYADDGPAGPRLIAFLDGVATTFELPAGRSIVIGRSRDCGVRIDHPSISRHHARLHTHPSLEIEDLGSANGTCVSNEAVEGRLPVALGSVVEIGDVRTIVAAAPRKSPAMDQAHALADTAAKGSISVLIRGETGAGKEVMARRIHDRSPRAGGPFIAVNCAALPQHLLESELFGHEKGAFTGANTSRKGLLEAASTGSVLLDEIGDMPPPTQAKILRVLETREVLPVGGVQTRSIDVRFISATNRDLPSMVTAGTFREDLLFRIGGMTVLVPPLRERAAEIREIAKLLLTRECERAKKPLHEFTPAALVLLESYRWPGNVRELRSAIERALLVARNAVIAEGDIEVSDAGGAEDPPLPPHGERARIEAALERCGGNQTEAAKFLHMSRRLLGKQLDRFGIKRPRKR